MSVTPFYRGQYGDNGMFGSVDGRALGNRGAFARFSRVAVPNEEKSKEQQIPMFDEEIHCEILMPGDPLNIPKRRVKVTDAQGKSIIVGQDYIDRFPKEWEAFEGGHEQMPDGTPLDQWPNKDCTKALVATLNAQHIFTVQQLAACHDGVMDKVMGMRELRAAARAYCEQAVDSAAAQRSAAAEEAAKAELAQVREQLSNLQKQMEIISRAGAITAGAMAPTEASLSSPIVTDPLVGAAMASGGKPVDAEQLQVMKRPVGRPRKEAA